jgi:HlyD family secretion protein
MKNTMRKIIIALIAILIVSFVVYQLFFKEGKSIDNLVEVSRGKISREVFETGQVKRGGEINLGFETAGKIEKIYVKVGEKVKSGDKLAKLDTSSLFIQLQEARASLDLAQAKLDKLLAGSTPEEIKIIETQVANARISLTTANENLSQAYEDALTTLEDSYLKIYNALNTVGYIQRTYFAINDQEAIKIKESKEKIERALDTSQTHLNLAKSSSKSEDIDTALLETKNALEDTSEALKIVRETCERPVYRTTISSSDKTSLDNQRTYINTSLTSVINSQQTISSKKLSIEAAEGQLQAAENELENILSAPREEDVELYEAQVNQAQAQVQLLQKQIQEATLTAPVSGQITKINKEIGELVQPMLQEAVISILPEAPFEIKVDIYEEDVVKIDVGNPVEISLVPFPEQTLMGEVINIDPAEKLIEGVVYYEAVINFEEIPDNLKPGMTADLKIEIITKENVLIVPEDAIQEKDDKVMVQVCKNGTFEERIIEIGLLGSNDMVEVVSGLKEGERVLITP